MKLLTYLKKSASVLTLLVLAIFVLNFGSYNPHNELAALSPDTVSAMGSTSTAYSQAVQFCNVSASATRLYVGSDVTISWDTQGYSDITLNGESVSGDSGSKTFTNLQVNTTYTLIAENPGDNSKCITEVNIICLANPVPTCTLTPENETIYIGESVDLTWATENAASVNLTNFGNVDLSGTQNTGPLTADMEYWLNVEGVNGDTITCDSIIKVIPPPDPAPTCTLSPAHETIYIGESVDLVWTTENAASVNLTDFGDVDFNGTQNTGVLTANKGYWLTVLGTNGDTKICDSVIKVIPPPTTPFCELTLDKSVNTATAEPGDELTYTINIKNTGTADCTGGGVRIVDIHDENVSFISETHTDNLSAGYGSYPLYEASTRTLFWNGHTLTPGEEGSITWKGKVNEALTCGTNTIIKNKAKATARELDYFTTWSYSNIVETNVYKACEVPAPTCDMFSVSPSTITRGNSAELTWSTTNAVRVVIDNGIGEVLATDKLSVTPLQTTDYTLTVFGENDQRDVCEVQLIVKEPPVVDVPQCLAFSATPFTLPFGGGESTLEWSTENADLVIIDNNIGGVATSGTQLVNISTTTTYHLAATDGQTEDFCDVTINVEPQVLPPAPTCTLTPATQTIASGGSVDLVWATTNASTSSLTDFGTVTASGTQNTGALTAPKTYILDVVGTNGDTISCNSEIVIDTEPQPITCGNNVSLSVSPNTFKRGGSASISWSTTDITSVSFDNNITATSLSGSVTVSPSVSTSYLMTATDGVDTISCPIALSVTTGGGGGGSSPTCELSVSDNKIIRGEEVELKWDSRRAGNLFILDSNNNTIVTTKDLFGDDKEDLFDGVIKISPTKDTTYTMTVERGSRDRTCDVSVDVEDNIVVTQIRDQQPLIAGIALTQVPYTGFEAGPILTIIFYVLLALWALYIAYLFVIRRGMIEGFRATAATEAGIEKPLIPNIDSTETSAAGGVTKNIKTSETVLESSESLHPTNLPTGTPVVGNVNANSSQETDGASTDTHNIGDEITTQIENHAHQQKVLLSSDAIRHFIGTVGNTDEKMVVLDQVIVSSKAQYPSEDGWVVINEKRMRELCLVCIANNATSTEAPHMPAVVPEGTGSLAEAIVIGNIMAAYEMIGSRPMFALADAAAELDNIYCIRKGKEGIVVSELLKTETAKFTDEQIHEMITALTGALDGTYTDEGEAVKIAIMKTVKIASTK